MPIEYDPTNQALLQPELRPTLFEPGLHPTPLQLGIEAARLAYVRIEESAAELQRLVSALAAVGFGQVRAFQSDPEVGAEAFGAIRPADGTALLAFRGTQPDKMADLCADINAVPVPWGLAAGMVHKGFRAAFLAIYPEIENWLRDEAHATSTLIVCGHSLGAAMATLSASVFRPTLLVTLGCPRVGDTTFLSTLTGTHTYRLVNCCDVVTRVPPPVLGYEHPASLTYIDPDGQVLAHPTESGMASDCIQANLHYAANYMLQAGNAPMRGLADHAPINYARAFFG